MVLPAVEWIKMYYVHTYTYIFIISIYYATYTFLELLVLIYILMAVLNPLLYTRVPKKKSNLLSSFRPQLGVHAGGNTLHYMKVGNFIITVFLLIFFSTQ